MKGNVHDKRLAFIRDESLPFVTSECDFCPGGGISFLLPLGPYLELAKHAGFAALVGPGGPWDYKDSVRKRLQHSQLYSRLHDGSDVEVGYDVWGNINYGYTGAAAGYSLEILQAAQLLAEGKNDRSDSLAIDIGYELWADFGEALTERQLQSAVRAAKSGFEHAAELDRDEFVRVRTWEP